jgi:predicted nucleic acid-binding protein
MAKEKVICDTDVLIDYFDITQKRHQETKLILEQNIGISNILISSITKMELILGATNKADLSAISKKTNRFSILLINEAINLRAGRIALDFGW